MQNNLSELHAVLDLINEGCLGDKTEFSEYYAEPIMRSRNRTASAEVFEYGKKKMLELQRVMDRLVIRRTKVGFSVQKTYFLSLI